jgi:DNA-binding NarL/FixJ family response regulator
VQSAAASLAILDSVPVYRTGLVALCEASGITTVELPSRGELTRAASPGALVAAVRTEADWRFVEQHCARQDAGPVVALVPVLSPLVAERALAAGAAGVIEIGASGDDVIQVVRAALQGKTLLPRGIAHQVGSDAARVRRLSASEIEWLRALARGLTVSKLADEAGYSEREMYRHLSRLYSRLGVRGRTQALLCAERLGLLREGDAVDSQAQGELTEDALQSRSLIQSPRVGR